MSDLLGFIKIWTGICLAITFALVSVGVMMAFLWWIGRIVFKAIDKP